MTRLMIFQNNDIVTVVTTATVDDWAYRICHRLRVLAAAAGNPNLSQEVNESLMVEIEATIDMIPDEFQMRAALAVQPAGAVPDQHMRSSESK